MIHITSIVMRNLYSIMYNISYPISCQTLNSSYPYWLLIFYKKICGFFFLDSRKMLVSDFFC